MKETVDDVRKRVQAAQWNYAGNLREVEEILLHERGFVFRAPHKAEDVMMLCSGGLDSSVAMDIVFREWEPVVHPVYIKRGAKAEKFEEAAFDFFVELYGERYPDLVANPIKIRCAIPSKDIKALIPEAYTQTIGHPLRNSSMQNRAVEYAVALNAKNDLRIRTILTGSVGEDKTEPELGLLSLRTQTLNTCVQMGDWEWQVASPLTEPYISSGMHRPICKTGLIRHAHAYSIPLEKTRTCFSGSKIADGTCHACVKRLAAFDYERMVDSLPYLERPEKYDREDLR